MPPRMDWIILENHINECEMENLYYQTGTCINLSGVIRGVHVGHAYKNEIITKNCLTQSIRTRSPGDKIHFSPLNHVDKFNHTKQDKIDTVYLDWRTMTSEQQEVNNRLSQYRLWRKHLSFSKYSAIFISTFRRKFLNSYYVALSRFVHVHHFIRCCGIHQEFLNFKSSVLERGPLSRRYINEEYARN